jgi:hypothetical protein
MEGSLDKGSRQGGARNKKGNAVQQDEAGQAATTGQRRASAGRSGWIII